MASFLGSHNAERRAFYFFVFDCFILRREEAPEYEKYKGVSAINNDVKFLALSQLESFC